MTDVHHDSVQYSLKPKLFGGYVVIVRRGVPDEYPGTWRWGMWREAGRSELSTIMRRLTEDMP